MKKKLIDISVKADGQEQGLFTAYASTFTRTPDSYGDVVAPGAFKDSLEEWAASGNVIPVLWGHDFSDPYKNIGSVVEAFEDEHGLKVTGQLDMDNPLAQQVYRLLKAKRVSQMSFAFDVLDSVLIQEDGEQKHELRKLKLYEVSIVPVGANQDTEILEVKHASKAEDAEQPQELDEDLVLPADLVGALEKAKEAILTVLESAQGNDNENQGSASEQETSESKQAPVELKSQLEALSIELAFLDL